MVGLIKYDKNVGHFRIEAACQDYAYEDEEKVGNCYSADSTISLYMCHCMQQ
jgi:hypothetical protein